MIADISEKLQIIIGIFTLSMSMRYQTNTIYLRLSLTIDAANLENAISSNIAEHRLVHRTRLRDGLNRYSEFDNMLLS